MINELSEHKRGYLSTLAEPEVDVECRLQDDGNEPKNPWAIPRRFQSFLGEHLPKSTLRWKEIQIHSGGFEPRDEISKAHEELIQL